MRPPSTRGLRFGVARVTLELTSPLAIGTGDSHELADVVCVIDGGGLPAIPGSTLAGLLRHALADGGDPETHATCRAEFGFQTPAAVDQGGRTVPAAGQSSRVEVSWASVHDASDHPVPFSGPLDGDPVVALLREGITRDHVRLDERGVVDGRGKHSRACVPAGARFTFEVLRHIDHTDRDRALAELLALLAPLQRPDLRLGQAVRAGYGTFRVHRVCARALVLDDDERQAARSDWDALQQLPQDLSEPVPPEVLPEVGLPLATTRRFVHGRLVLQPEDTWMFGGGDPASVEAIPSGRQGRRQVDLVPYAERRIEWSHGMGRVDTLEQAPFLLVASGVKGALRHRTAFHHRVLQARWAPTRREQESEWPTGSDAAEVLWFGDARDEDKDGPTGTPGVLLLGDVYVGRSLPLALHHHVSLDRFTQAPIDGALFSEAPLWGAPEGKLVMEFSIDLDTLRRGLAGRHPALRAFGRAVNDLCQGRLALGGGSSRGHGWFTGRWEVVGANGQPIDGAAWLASLEDDHVDR